MGALKEPVVDLYEQDFAAWAFEQAEAIKRNDWRALDVPNLVEELESMGKQQRAELVAMADAWKSARINAATETGLSRVTFPVQCPYTWDEAIQEDWLPE